MPEGAEGEALATGLEVWQLRTLALGFVWGKAAGLALSVSACNALELPPVPQIRKKMDWLIERGYWAGGVRGVEGQGRAAA